MTIYVYVLVPLPSNVQTSDGPLRPIFEIGPVAGRFRVLTDMI